MEPSRCQDAITEDPWRPWSKVPPWGRQLTLPEAFEHPCRCRREFSHPPCGWSIVGLWSLEELHGPSLPHRFIDNHDVLHWDFGDAEDSIWSIHCFPDLAQGPLLSRRCELLVTVRRIRAETIHGKPSAHCHRLKVYPCRQLQTQEPNSILLDDAALSHRPRSSAVPGLLITNQPILVRPGFGLGLGDSHFAARWWWLMPASIWHGCITITPPCCETELFV